jgi:hypothetical protein
MRKKLSNEDKINASNLGIGYYLGGLVTQYPDSKETRKTIENFYKSGLISKEFYDKCKNISKELTKLLLPLKNNALR